MSDHSHPGQAEPRAHGETHHEDRIVDLNSAAEEEIANLPMVGPRRARDTVEQRPFSSWDEVKSVSGFGSGMVDHLKSGDAQLGAAQVA